VQFQLKLLARCFITRTVPQPHEIHLNTLNRTHELTSFVLGHLHSHTPAFLLDCLAPFFVLFCITSLHERSGGRTSRSLREDMLLGATTSCYTALSSRLLDPSSPQVRRQFVQVDDHHLCPGMAPNPVYDVVDPGDDDVGAFPARLQLW